MTFASKTLVMTHAAVSVVAYSAWFPPPPKLIWNASASVPIGLYQVEPTDTFKAADLVVVRPPEALEKFLTVPICPLPVANNVCFCVDAATMTQIGQRLPAIVAVADAPTFTCEMPLRLTNDVGTPAEPCTVTASFDAS